MNKLGFAITAMLAAAVCSSAVRGAFADEREPTHKTVKFEDTQWVTSLADKVVVQDFRGRSALNLQGSLNNYVYVQDSSFRDGTIEVDIAVEARGTAGIGFRGSTDGTRCDKVCFLFIADTGGTGENPVRQAVISRRDGLLCVLRLKPERESDAGPTVRHEEWSHVKLVVVGSRLEVFLNNGDEPVFVIERMLDASGPGTVGVRGRGVHFSNFCFVPSTPESS